VEHPYLGWLEGLSVSDLSASHWFFATYGRPRTALWVNAPADMLARRGEQKPRTHAAPAANTKPTVILSRNLIERLSPSLVFDILCETPHTLRQRGQLCHNYQ
jgi:hypothetical protein